MSALADWPHVFRPGSDDGPVVITLHGTGGNETESVHLADMVAPGSPVISPRGQVSEHGMARWFARVGEGVFDVDDVIARSAELAQFITDATAHYELAGRAVVAVGFSNGANIAQATALLHPDVVARVVAFSGMYPFGDRDPVTDATGVKILSLGGDADPMAPSHSVDRLVQVATDHGAEVTRLSRPGGHGITPDEVTQARSWVTSVL